MVKNLPAMWETRVGSLGWEDPLEKRMATTPVFLPGESHRLRSRMGYGPWGHKESDRTERPSHTVLQGRVYITVNSNWQEETWRNRQENEITTFVYSPKCLTWIRSSVELDGGKHRPPGTPCPSHQTVQEKRGCSALQETGDNWAALVILDGGHWAHTEMMGGQAGPGTQFNSSP